MEVLRKIADDIKSAYKIDTDIDRYVQRAIDYALFYCNRTDIPPLCIGIVTAMAETLIKGEGIIATDNDVQSMSVGDTGITYDNAFKKSAWEKTDFNSQLNHFKRIKLLEKEE